MARNHEAGFGRLQTIVAAGGAVGLLALVPAVYFDDEQRHSVQDSLRQQAAAQVANFDHLEGNAGGQLSPMIGDDRLRADVKLKNGQTCHIYYTTHASGEMASQTHMDNRATIVDLGTCAAKAHVRR